jgi:hypothetical protein
MSSPSNFALRCGLNTVDGSTSYLLFKADHLNTGTGGNTVTATFPKSNPQITWTGPAAMTFAVGTSNYVLAVLTAAVQANYAPPSGPQTIKLTVTANGSNSATGSGEPELELYSSEGVANPGAPTVTSFSAQADLGHGEEGLKTQNKSSSQAEVTGANLYDGCPIQVWNKTTGPTGEPRWSGTLNYNPGKGTFKANLKCTNTSGAGPGTTGDTDEVCVTVTTVSPPYDATSVHEGR